MTLTEATALVRSSGRHLLLDRVPPVSEWNLAPATGEVVRACIVDTETTGVADDDEVIELAILPFDYCRETGRVVAVHPGFNSFCQPSKPIPAEATAVHGITDEMVAGHSISDAQVAEAVGGAKLLLAHNALFDRKMASKWPLLDTIPWGCSWFDIDWRAGGIESGKLAFILMRMGFFFDGHRAMDDCLATLFMLTQNVGENSALFALLQTLREPLYKVMLFNTPFSSKNAINARGGYRWAPDHRDGKNWWKVTADKRAELEWANALFGLPCRVDDLAEEWKETRRMPPRETFVDVRKLPPIARHSTQLEAA